jgi:hypothetical protein
MFAYLLTERALGTGGGCTAAYSGIIDAVVTGRDIMAPTSPGNNVKLHINGFSSHSVSKERRLNGNCVGL